MSKNENFYWSEEANARERYHTPPGIFTKDADEIVDTLMEGAHDDAVMALRRLVFYMNRAGDKLTNTKQLNKAKSKLEEMECQDYIQ